jgi:hypothetical protein
MYFEAIFRLREREGQMQNADARRFNHRLFTRSGSTNAEQRERLAAQLRATSCLVAASFAFFACDQPTDPNLVPEQIVLLTPAVEEVFVGQPVPTPIEVQVLNRAGQGVPGIRVEFRVAIGAGGVSESNAVTDSTGRASVTFIPGSQGANRLDAVVERWNLSASWATYAIYPRTLVLVPDRIQMDSVGDWSMTETHVFDPNVGPGRILALHPDWALTDSTIVELCVQMTTGTYRGMRRLIHALRPGTTQIIARYKDAADTAVVTVEGPFGSSAEPHPQCRSGL